MAIDSYGGNPDIIVAQEEIDRVALELKLCASELTETSLESFIQDPIRRLQFQIATAGIYQKLERLHNHCLIAKESYFTAEAQIHRRFEITFIPELAKLVAGISNGLGWKLDSTVTATKTLETRAQKPDSITKILDRLWEVSARPKPTIGIDIYRQNQNRALAIVYVPGTQDVGFGSTTNPLDMASNLQAMANANSAASEKAVLAAIKQAGIGALDEVILVGHSQGGMVAGNLALTPTGFISAGLISFGAPIAQLANIKSPVMAVEHVNDPIPNISGRANPLKSNWVTIQRVSEKTESNAPLYSHSLKSYRNTTTEIDGSTDQGIRSIRTKLLSKLQGSKPEKSLEFVISRESR